MRVNRGIVVRGEFAVGVVDQLFVGRMRLVHDCDFNSRVTSLRSWLRARCSRDRTVPIEHPTISAIS